VGELRPTRFQKKLLKTLFGEIGKMFFFIPFFSLLDASVWKKMFPPVHPEDLRIKLPFFLKRKGSK